MTEAGDNAIAMALMIYYESEQGHGGLWLHKKSIYSTTSSDRPAMPQKMRS
jgi:hypothetical protein